MKKTTTPRIRTRGTWHLRQAKPSTSSSSTSNSSNSLASKKFNSSKSLTIGVITVILVLALGSLVFFTDVFVGKAIGDADNAWLSPAQLQVTPGQQFTVDLEAKITGNSYGFKATVAYDSTKMLLEGDSNIDDVLDGWVVEAFPDAEAGEVVLLGYNPELESATGQFRISTLEFVASDSLTGSAIIDLVDAKFSHQALPSDFSDDTQITAADPCADPCPGGVCNPDCVEEPVLIALGCGESILEAGNYLLEEGFGPCEGSGMEIEESDVTFDCGGQTISGGEEGVGITVTTQSTVKNCLIEGFERGILAAGVDDVTVQSNTITGSSIGIEFESGDRATIDDNTIESDNGISLSGVDGLEVTKNTIQNGAGTGLYLSNIEGDKVIEDNTVQGHDKGIVIEDFRPTLDRNTACSNDLDLECLGDARIKGSGNTFGVADEDKVAECPNDSPTFDVHYQHCEIIEAGPELGDVAEEPQRNLPLTATPACGLDADGDDNNCDSFENCATCSEDCGVCNLGDLIGQCDNGNDQFSNDMDCDGVPDDVEGDCAGNDDCDLDGVSDSRDYCPGTPGELGITVAGGLVGSDGCLLGDVAGTKRDGSIATRSDGCLADEDYGIIVAIASTYDGFVEGGCVEIEEYCPLQAECDDSNDCDEDGVANSDDCCPGTLGSLGLTKDGGFVNYKGCLLGDVASVVNDEVTTTPDGCLDESDYGKIVATASTYDGFVEGGCQPFFAEG